MHESFLDLNYKCEQWFLAVDRMALADRRISHNACLARDTQRVAVPRHNEENGDVRVLQ